MFRKEPKKKHEAFISYYRADARTETELIRLHLRREFPPLACWKDERDHDRSEGTLALKLETIIFEQIKLADTFLLVLGGHLEPDVYAAKLSDELDWVNREIREAKRLGKKIIIARFGAAAPSRVTNNDVAAALSNPHDYVNFVADSRQWDSAVKKLYTLIRGAPPARGNTSHRSLTKQFAEHGARLDRNIEIPQINTLFGQKRRVIIIAAERHDDPAIFAEASGESLNHTAKCDQSFGNANEIHWHEFTAPLRAEDRFINLVDQIEKGLSLPSVDADASNSETRRARLAKMFRHQRHPIVFYTTVDSLNAVDSKWIFEYHQHWVTLLKDATDSLVLSLLFVPRHSRWSLAARALPVPADNEELPLRRHGLHKVKAEHVREFLAQRTGRDTDVINDDPDFKRIRRAVFWFGRYARPFKVARVHLEPILERT